VRLAYISKNENLDELEEHYEKATPSLSQRAYLIAGSLELTNYMLFVFYGFLVAVIALAAFVTYPSNTTVQVFRNEINDIVAVAIFTSIVLALIYFFLYRRNIQRLKDWQLDYLEQSYIIVFETILPKGNTTSEKVLNLSRAVFPELTPEYASYGNPVHRFEFFVKNKLKPTKRESALQTVNYKGKPYPFDIVLDTLKGYFIIKDFKDKVVSFEDLKQLTDIAGKKFKDIVYRETKVFRILCVAKEYDQRLMQQDTLERLMTKELKADFYIDLIVEEKTGFSVLWVGY
jgi:hypothetical protein